MLRVKSNLSLLDAVKLVLAFVLLQVVLCTVLMAFPVIVVMLWIRVLEGAAFVLFGGGL